MRLKETDTLERTPCLYLTPIKSYRKKRLSLVTSQGQYRFLSITFDRNNIDTWGRHQSIRPSRRDASNDSRHDSFRSIRDLHLWWPEVEATRKGHKVTKWPLGGSQAIWIDPPWPEKHDGGKISALSQTANTLLTKNYRPEKRYLWPDLERQRLTWIGKVTHHWIQIVREMARTFVMSNAEH